MRQTVLDASQLTSLMLVFVTTFFGLRYPTVVSDLDKEPPAGPKAREVERKRLIHSFAANCLPPLVVNAVSVYLLLPLAVKIFMTSRLAVWDFDVVLTSFIFVFAWIVAFLVWSSSLGYAMVKKIRQLKTIGQAQARRVAQ